MGDEGADSDDGETSGTDRYIVDEDPEFRSPNRGGRESNPNPSYSGYDGVGDTRVGIGELDGDVDEFVRQNEGRHRSDGDHSLREAIRDKKRLTESFCSILGVTPYQQQRAIAAMLEMNLDRFGRHKRIAKVSLATIKIIVERDRYHQFQRNVDLSALEEEQVPDGMLDDSTYCDLLEEYDVSRADLYSVSQMIKRELKQREFFEQGRQAPDGDGTDEPDETNSEPGLPLTIPIEHITSF